MTPTRVRSAAVILIALVSGACSPPGAPPPTPVVVSLLPSPLITRALSLNAPANVGSMVAIDTASIRPSLIRRGGIELPALVTTFQGSRYHPETIRALANDTSVLADFARGLILGAARDQSIILDFQSGTPDDAPELVSVARAIGQQVRTREGASLSIVVPARDTVAYPTLILARVADVLVVRLLGEHGPGTAPGPLVTEELVARAIGMRARLIGASRIGAELPLYGYLWRASGVALPITYQEAQELVRSEAGVFSRDPPTQFLTATGRDGWTLWVPDSRTIQHLARIALRRGVVRLYLAGTDGADPSILTPEARQTIIRSR